MESAKVTLNLTPSEFGVINSALYEYKKNLTETISHMSTHDGMALRRQLLKVTELRKILDLE